MTKTQWRTLYNHRSCRIVKILDKVGKTKDLTFIFNVIEYKFVVLALKFLRTTLESKGYLCTTLDKTNYPEKEISTKNKILRLHFQYVKPMMIKKKTKKKN